MHEERNGGEPSLDDLSPQIGATKVAYVKKFLTERSGGGKKVRIVEWGAGGSTTHFTKWLREAGIPFEWIALEYDPEWYKRVHEQVRHDPSVELVLFETKNAKHKDVPMDEYVLYPRTRKEKGFDLIFVDGRKRRRCLLEAADLLAPGGIVFLHDAWRTHYQCAFTAYPTSRFVDRSLWKGTLEIPSPLQKIQNFVVNTYYKTRGRFREARKYAKRKIETVMS